MRFSIASGSPYLTTPQASCEKYWQYFSTNLATGLNLLHDVLPVLASHVGQTTIYKRHKAGIGELSPFRQSFTGLWQG
jgi:hypothetical protein